MIATTFSYAHTPLVGSICTINPQQMLPMEFEHY